MKNYASYTAITVNVKHSVRVSSCECQNISGTSCNDVICCELTYLTKQGDASLNSLPVGK